MQKWRKNWCDRSENGKIGGIRQIICVRVSSIAKGIEGEAFGICSHPKSQYWLGFIVTNICDKETPGDGVPNRGDVGTWSNKGK